VTINFTGWMADSGVKFDGSDDRGRSVDFALPKVVKGFQRGPAADGGGREAAPVDPGQARLRRRPRKFGNPYGTLVFDVELVGIRHPPEPPVVPADLNAPPGDARKTSSGLVYRCCAGHRQGPPEVAQHRRGPLQWLDAGRQDVRQLGAAGEAATFPLNGVIRGWTEGVQLMVVGEKARFWIPAKLAYGDSASAGTPSGTLVFDIELLAIKD
jgi:peptidylprolyl isomerase